MEHISYTEIFYYIVILDDEVISYGDLLPDQVLSTNQYVEMFDNYDLYAKRLRDFAIHLNLKYIVDK